MIRLLALMTVAGQVASAPGPGAAVRAHGGAVGGPGPGPAEACVETENAPVVREALLMGTRLRITIPDVSRTRGLAASEAALDEVTRVESLLSTWRDDTELSALNRSPAGRPLTVTRELLSVLMEVRRLSEETVGAFDPVVGSLIEAWDLRGQGRIPSREALQRALEDSGIELLALDEDRGTATRLAPGARLDAGAFGKGLALRGAAAALAAAGIQRALLDFGGQLSALGAGPCFTGWTVEVARPRGRTEALGALSVADRSVATSGASERFVEVRGQRFGHVLDPRSGAPVPAWGSVTVVARDPVAADVLSTALFVMGADEALAWSRSREDVGVLVVDGGSDHERIRWNRAMAPYLTEGFRGEGPPARSQE